MTEEKIAKIQIESDIKDLWKDIRFNHLECNSEEWKKRFGLIKEKVIRFHLSEFALRIWDKITERYHYNPNPNDFNN